MKKAVTFLRSFHFWFSLFLISAILFPVGCIIFLLTFAFDRNRTILYYFSSIWSNIILFLNPYWKIKMQGRSNIKRGNRYVMVANHSSGVDILILFRLFRPFKWVAKKSLFYLPFIGWNMWLTGCIPIERTRGRSKLEMMGKAAGAIRDGNSVMIFPEGTRTTDGRIKQFKSGSFRLALETETPILPIAIKGTFWAIKKGGISVHSSNDLRVMVMEPVPYEQFRGMDPKDIARMIQEMIKNQIESVS